MIAISAAAAMALPMAACGSKNGDSKSGEKQKFIVGFDAAFPPYGYQDENGEYVGFDLDLAEAVIKQMGSKMEFKSMGFDALIPAVQSGQIDMIASGLSANPEREKQVAFSDVYFDKNRRSEQSRCNKN